MKTLKGIFPYLVSPVEADGRIKESVLRRLIEDLIGSGVHGIVVLGSTGEFFYLDASQRKEIVRIAIDQAAGRVPVIAGVAAGAVHDAVNQARCYEAMGADGILVILNVYFPLDQNAIYRYFAGIAESVKVETILYNNPKFTGFEISTATLLALSKYDNINYYKDASTNTGRLLELYEAAEGRLQIFSASAHVPEFVMMLGGAGWMAGPACAIPKQSVRLYELCVEKKWDEAMELQRKLWKLNVIFQKYGPSASIKAALKLQGYDVGDPIAPCKCMPEDGIRELAAVLEELKEL